MVDINVTIVAQVLHFLLMWWFLDRFFFRFVVEIVQKERAKLRRLNNSIKKEQDLLLAQQEQQKKQWQQFRKKFGKKAPPVESGQDVVPNLELPHIAHLTKAGKAELLKHTKTIIIKKVLAND